MHEKLQRIDQIEQLASGLRNGHRGMLGSKGDYFAAAIVGFLIDYSLTRLMLAEARDNDALRNAMLANLHKIVTNPQFNFAGFSEARKLIDDSGFDPKLVGSLTMGTERGVAPDRNLFQQFIEQLRPFSSAALTPFYCYDEDKKSIYTVH
jgi:hypothetical protein